MQCHAVPYHTMSWRAMSECAARLAYVRQNGRPPESCCQLSVVIPEQQQSLHATESYESLQVCWRGHMQAKGLAMSSCATAREPRRWCTSSTAAAQILWVTSKLFRQSWSSLLKTWLANLRQAASMLQRCMIHLHTSANTGRQVVS